MGPPSKGGYGHFAGTQAHIYSWEHANGPVPPGMILDHGCRRRRCIHNDHLEPVTVRENNRRAQLAMRERRLRRA
jgi:hypothetical protein